MDKELSEGSFFTRFTKNILTIFSLSVFAISVVGMASARFVPSTQETSSMFAFAPSGLTYNAIMQLACFSIVMAAVSAVLFSEYLIAKLRFLWRIFILFIAALVIFYLFVVIFNWFHINEPLTLLVFFLLTLICYSISVGLTILKLKLERKKYSKLLEKYKARNNLNSLNSKKTA